MSAEIKTRDPEWFKTGKPCKVEYALDWHDGEKKTASGLGRLGFNVLPQERSLKYRQRRCDSLLNGEKWEFKCPTGAGNMTVYNQFKKAVLAKYGTNIQSDKLIISNSRSQLTFDQMNGSVKRIFDNNEWVEIREVLVLDLGNEESPKLKRWRRYEQNIVSPCFISSIHTTVGRG